MGKENAPEKGQAKLTITVEKYLLVRLREEAGCKGYTLKDLITFVLQEHFENTARQ